MEIGNTGSANKLYIFGQIDLSESVKIHYLKADILKVKPGKLFTFNRGNLGLSPCYETKNIHRSCIFLSMYYQKQIKTKGHGYFKTVEQL